ncbi:hypothetical protein [Allofournierella massiliensis]|uniref:hypothetical protein n=1 Tax=Allofournierella massiliensis TaxID=1650663 RepID=UPI0024B28393|nr:hypothetical protein [Fournierella massiliensis]
MKQVIAALLIPWAKQEITQVKRKQPANQPSNMKSVPQSDTPYFFTLHYLLFTFKNPERGAQNQ